MTLAETATTICSAISSRAVILTTEPEMMSYGQLASQFNANQHTVLIWYLTGFKGIT